MSSSPRIFAALANEEHAEAVAAFYREVWDPAATAASVVAATRRDAERNVVDPGVPPPIALIFVGARVVGYCGSIPHRMWDGVREKPAYWVKGLMVLPEYRNGPIGFLAVKELARHLDCSTILAVAPAARRLFTALGYADLGAVSNWIRPLRPGIIAEKLDLESFGADLPGWLTEGIRLARRAGLVGLVANAAGAAIDAASRISRLPASHLDTAEHADPSREDLDELWMEARSGLRATPVRDGTYIKARYAERTDGVGEGNPYILVTTRERGRLLGFAAVRKPSATPDPRLGGIRVATGAELVFPVSRTDAALATLGAIERLSRGAGAAAVTHMTSHPALSALLRRQGYLRVGGNVHFFLRDVSGTGRWPTDLAAWWLGRGDGESDSSF